MRHRVYGKHLGRNNNERQSLFKGLVYSLLSYGTIQTSETKAKAIKGLVDRIINLIKRDLTATGQPTVNFFLTNKNLRGRIKDEIIPKLGTRISGYTRLVKMGARLGDQAMMVQISLIGAEKLKPFEKESRVPTESRTLGKTGVKSLESSKKNIQMPDKEEKIIKPKLSKKATKASTTKRGGKKS